MLRHVISGPFGLVEELSDLILVTKQRVSKLDHLKVSEFVVDHLSHVFSDDPVLVTLFLLRIHFFII